MGKTMSEEETRRKLLRYAKRIGAEKDLQNIFDKWDRLMLLVPESERSDMSKMAILEVQSTLDIHAEGGLTINGEVIIPPGAKDV